MVNNTIAASHTLFLRILVNEIQKAKMALVSLTAAVIMTLNALTHKTLQVNHRCCKFNFFEKTFQTNSLEQYCTPAESYFRPIFRQLQ